MLKRTVPYEDYNGNMRNEDFYFDLNEAEIAEMEMSINGGLSEMIKSIIAAQDMAAMGKLYKDLILKAYGEKSLDGKYFNKSEEISRAFSCTSAYSIIYMELLTDATKAAEFFNGIIPKKGRTDITPEQILAMANTTSVGVPNN